MHDSSFHQAATRSAEVEADLRLHPDRYRVLTGDRPTGALHLGHYFGTLANRVRLQDLGVQVLLVVADYQVITDRDDPGDLRASVLDLLADQLAAGIDPARTPVFAHSAVPALNQLLLPFLSLVSVAELERNPTVKDEVEATHGRTVSGLMLTYPVHQAADILFCGANLVPVGRDQLPHLEVTRDVARRFGARYSPVFEAPDALLSDTPLLLGLDGHKMSKSRGNTIRLRDDEDTTVRAVRGALTDGRRDITYEPATRPGVATLLELAALCTDRDPADLAVGLDGAAALKALVAEAVNERFRGLRARRRELAADPGYLLGVLADGNAHANALAQATLDQVREAMGTVYR
ncbi:tryptophanyl-tRNA synthetase [Klenkia soli]|uniref:Tryptophan--tRNA ligase n=1 Tax=Klenkia soli TaxID=1052260 RepID=A0A1H0KV45_9ACTN|nr:tryptophan--tRNA ligase [Klenkia soli]SDO59884.1 tryptophanyl-tRNA synthetase [Klenkia soli]